MGSTRERDLAGRLGGVRASRPRARPRPLQRPGSGCVMSPKVTMALRDVPGWMTDAAGWPSASALIRLVRIAALGPDPTWRRQPPSMWQRCNRYGSRARTVAESYAAQQHGIPRPLRIVRTAETRVSAGRVRRPAQVKAFARGWILPGKSVTWGLNGGGAGVEGSSGNSQVHAD